ncbi:putative C2 domain, phosphoribosyltransferase, C2 domain superfamily [Helianthus annuus]|nr:putative C2 domain, phosphoribosyltransferase, C2 domain superfamily [Helianthus annuus]
MYPMWNEDLMFVAAEPFEEQLILSVEDRVAPNKEEVLGMCAIPLQYVERRLDHRLIITPRWFSLHKHVMIDGEIKEVKFASKIHMRICLEGGYHVLDESTHYSSDLRPTAKPLWKNSIGVLEVGILSAHGLTPMKSKEGRATTDAYFVALITGFYVLRHPRFRHRLPSVPLNYFRRLPAKTDCML